MKQISIAVIALTLLHGCAIKPVKAWEKGRLAKETMQPGNGNSAFVKFQHHIYFSKGGSGVAGGGCECN